MTPDLMIIMLRMPFEGSYTFNFNDIMHTGCNTKTISAIKQAGLNTKIKELVC